MRAGTGAWDNVQSEIVPNWNPGMLKHLIVEF